MRRHIACTGSQRRILLATKVVCDDFALVEKKDITELVILLT